MIPFSVTADLLRHLYQNLVTLNGEPDYARYRVMDSIQKRFETFFDLLHHSEDDLEIILTLVAKDPECFSSSPVRRLQALVDYVKIACAIYDIENTSKVNSTLH